MACLTFAGQKSDVAASTCDTLPSASLVSAPSDCSTEVVELFSRLEKLKFAFRAEAADVGAKLLEVRASRAQPRGSPSDISSNITDATWSTSLLASEAQLAGGVTGKRGSSDIQLREPPPADVASRQDQLQCRFRLALDAPRWPRAEEEEEQERQRPLPHAGGWRALEDEAAVSEEEEAVRSPRAAGEDEPSDEEMWRRRLHLYFAAAESTSWGAATAAACAHEAAVLAPAPAPMPAPAAATPRARISQAAGLAACTHLVAGAVLAVLGGASYLAPQLAGF